MEPAALRHRVTRFPARVLLSNAGVPVPLDVTQLNYPVVNTENSNMHTQQDKFTPGLAWNARACLASEIRLFLLVCHRLGTAFAVAAVQRRGFVWGGYG